MIVNKQDLIGCLSKIVPLTGNIANDVLSCILLECTGDSLYISGTNLESAVKIKIPASGSDKFKVCVHGKKFLEIVKNLGEEIEISVNGNLFISSEKSKFKLNTIDYAEYPDVLKITDYSFILSVNKQDIIDGINKVSFTIQSEQQSISYNIECLLIHITIGGMRFVGTDGYRLAILNKQKYIYETEKKFLIFSKYLKDIKKFISDSEMETIQIYFSDKKIMFETENGYMLVGITNGNFPDYESVIPNYNSYIKIKKEALLKAVKRTSIINEITRIVILSTNNNSLSVKSINQELGSAYEEIESENYTDDITIGINAKYLIEGLERVESEDVEIYIKESTKAIYFEDNNFKYILMPIRL